MTTTHNALKDATTQLRAVSDAPDIDATRLLLHVLDKQNASWLHAHPEYQLTAAETARYAQLVGERRTGKPLAYILGEWEFYGRSFLVNEHVLIPRPATEQLIDTALPTIEQLSTKCGRKIMIADIGTGSGCIAITLALELAEFQISNFKFQILATDISKQALVIAQKNAARHGVLDRIEFLHGNMLEPFDSAQGKPLNIDLIVSNPPYVPSSELDTAATSPETAGLRYEPRQALDGGPDGQDFTQVLMETTIPVVIEATGGKIVKNPAFAKGSILTQTYSLFRE